MGRRLDNAPCVSVVNDALDTFAQNYRDITGQDSPLPKPAAAQLVAAEAILAHRYAVEGNFSLLNFHMHRLTSLLKVHPDLLPSNLEFLAKRLYLLHQQVAPRPHPTGN